MPNHYARLARAAHRRVHGPIGAGHRVAAIVVGATLGLTAGSMAPTPDVAVPQEQRLQLQPLPVVPPWAKDEARAAQRQIPGCHDRRIVRDGQIREVWVDRFGLPCEGEDP